MLLTSGCCQAGRGSGGSGGGRSKTKVRPNMKVLRKPCALQGPQKLSKPLQGKLQSESLQNVLVKEHCLLVQVCSGVQRKVCLCTRIKSNLQSASNWALSWCSPELLPITIFKTTETSIIQSTVAYVGPTMLMNELRWCFFWNTATPSKKHKQGSIGLCFSVRLLVRYDLCNERFGQRSRINGRYPNVFVAFTVRVTSFIELRTSTTRSTSVLRIEVIATNTWSVRSMDVSSTPKLGSGLEAGWVLFEQQQVHMMPADHFFIVVPVKSVALLITNTFPWCCCRLAIWLDWCAWDLHGSWIARHFFAMFPDAVIHKKEPPCVPKSFDVPFMLYQGPGAVRKTSRQWYHCFLELLDSSLAWVSQILSFQPCASLFEVSGFFLSSMNVCWAAAASTSDSRSQKIWFNSSSVDSDVLLQTTVCTDTTTRARKIMFSLLYAIWFFPTLWIESCWLQSIEVMSVSVRCVGVNQIRRGEAVALTDYLLLTLGFAAMNKIWNLPCRVPKGTPLTTRWRGKQILDLLSHTWSWCYLPVQWFLFGLCFPGLCQGGLGATQPRNGQKRTRMHTQSTATWNACFGLNELMMIEALY